VLQAFKSKRLKILSYLTIIIFIISFNIFLPLANGLRSLDSTIGEAPIIDGSLDSTSEEWDKAKTYSLLLNNTPTDLGLPIEIGLIQDKNNLYIYIEFELETEYRSEEEFFGLIISENSSFESDNFIDAKILQFENTSTQTYNYLDYYINQSSFYQDTESDGEAAASIVNLQSIYEFSIPINNIEANNSVEDSYLQLGHTYAINFTYGDSPLYPEGIIKRKTVLVNIEENASEGISIDYKLILQILSYIIFAGLGILLGFYIYKIVILKRKIERIKG
jgi:hypothetical protein